MMLKRLKFIIICLVFCFLFSLNSQKIYTVSAIKSQIYDSEIKFISESSSSTTSELKSLALSLGLGTDTFSIKNHTYDMNSDNIKSILLNYEESLTDTEKFMFYCYNFEDLLESGCCFGLSALSVLVHNGYLTCDDIYQNSEKLYDIPLTDDVDNLIASYSLVQAHKRIQFKMGLNSISSSENSIIELLNCAQKCQDKEQYFLIAFQSDSFSTLLLV